MAFRRQTCKRARLEETRKVLGTWRRLAEDFAHNAAALPGCKMLSMRARADAALMFCWKNPTRCLKLGVWRK